jgi:hypothetical protein
MKRWLCALVLVFSGCSGATKAPPKQVGRGGFGGTKVELDAGRWLASDSKKAASAGAEASQVIAVQAGMPGDRVEGMVRVPERSCVALIARGTEGVEDVDLFVYADDGTAFGSDEAPDKRPTLMVCPERATRLYVVARIAQGNGVVAIGAQRVDAAEADRVAQAIGARNREGARDTESWPGLDESISRHREQIGGAWEDLRRVALPVDARVSSHVGGDVEADQCLDALVIPADEVSHLDVLAKDLEGRIVGRANAAGRERSLIVCSPTRARVTFEVRPHAGRGLAVVILSKSKKGTEQDIDAQSLRFDLLPPLDMAKARREHAERLDAAGYPPARSVAKGTLLVGRRQSVDLDLRAGCYRLDVWSQHPMHGVEAWLWSPTGSLIANERSGTNATLFACTRGAKARLDAEAMVRPGNYEVELREERETPEILYDHPLAASRLLGRMFARGVIKTAHQVGAPQKFPLTSTQLERMDVLVPVGRCVDIALALDPGANGAEIRLVDKTTGHEVALVRGLQSTSTRACALDRRDTLHVTAELRVATGAAIGLVATRMLAPRR